ncbi:MAG: hypothetical protein ACREXS_02070 [Gammaproteobacteria bacterium]
MSSFRRLFAAGVIIAGVVASGLTELKPGPRALTEPASAVHADDTFWSVEFGPGAANEKDGQVDPESVDLRSQIALLRSDLAKVQRQLRQLVQSAAHAQQSAKPSGTEKPADAVVLSEQELRDQDADVIEADNQRSLARMAAGETVLQQESADGVWSIQAMDALGQALGSEEFSSTKVQDMECRATLCRLEVVYADQEQQMRFEQHFSFKVGQLLPRMMMHSEEQTDGTISAVIYLAREGHDLPPPEY